MLSWNLHRPRKSPQIEPVLDLVPKILQSWKIGFTPTIPLLTGFEDKVSILPIITWPSRVLETRAAEVVVFDKALQELSSNMHSTMDLEGGIGLAANQVNVLQRVLTIYIPHSKERYGDDENEVCWWHNKRFTFVNPVVVKKKGGAIRSVEGCLSFPEIFDFVERAAEVEVRAQDEFGKEFTVEADGLLAVCLQHEIDHLDGIVFTERMSRLKANSIRKKMMNVQKEKLG